MIGLQTFYDEHPLNQGEILSKLSQAGKDLARLEPGDLFPFDQDHYGGPEATGALATRLELGPGKRVLDVCSGLGGTSRYLAFRHRCEVVGIGLNESRTAGAGRLTEMVGLAGLVTHLRGDALELDFEPECFDAAIGQEAFPHIPDKPRLLANCFRVLKPGWRLAFSDWLAFDGLPQDARERPRMFESLKEETVRRFGPERLRRYIEAYAFFVETIAGGGLGGGRFSACK